MVSGIPKELLESLCCAQSLPLMFRGERWPACELFLHTLPSPPCRNNGEKLAGILPHELVYSQWDRFYLLITKQRMIEHLLGPLCAGDRAVNELDVNP